MPENRIEYGLRNVHYAPYTEANGVVTFDAPIKIPGAVSLTTTARGDVTEFYADDMLYYSASNNQGYDGTLTIAHIPEQFLIDALGEELEETDKVLMEKPDKKGKRFALLFEFDGDVKATRHVLYNCTASRPGLSSSTKTATAEPNTKEITLIATSMDLTESLRLVKTKTTTATPDTVYNAWYDAVYKPTPAV